MKHLLLSSDLILDLNPNPHPDCDYIGFSHPSWSFNPSI